MEFFLGVHNAKWLETATMPLFISYKTMKRVKKVYMNQCKWALDSGAFSEIAEFGRFVTTPEIYARDADEINGNTSNLKWAAIQDWMCEPFMLAKTGLTTREHQRRTCKSLIELRRLSKGVHYIPVLQGWQEWEYLEHVKMYADLGINVTKESTVGVGSVCKRQHTDEAYNILKGIHDLGVKIHAFGFKRDGLIRCAKLLKSADSMAWSFVARRQEIKLPECRHPGFCANCFDFARQWYWEIRRDTE